MKREALEYLRAICRNRPELQREAERGVAHVEVAEVVTGDVAGCCLVTHNVVGDTGLLFDSFRSRAVAEELAAVIRRVGPMQTWGEEA